jgi:tetratricopeptide (TPR) repeat protein
MYDIKPLEEEWKKYKKKQRRPWYTLISVIILILFISLVFLNYKENDFFKFNDTNKIKKITDQSEDLIVDKALTKLEVKKPETTVDTEMKPMTVISSTNGSMEIVEDLPIPEDSTNVHKPKIKITTIEKPKVKIETATVEKPHKKIHLNIIETTNVNAYKDVAARFRQSHETDDSLFLAKAYYRKGNYKKAEYWALQTNKVNGNIEESWLIFIKSKVKLGHKNEAIRILTEYVKRSNSPQARILLEKMTKGAL